MIPSLTTRETEVAHLMVEGKTFRTISGVLDIAVSTVANYSVRIGKKLGAQGREAVCTKLLERERRVPIADLRRWRECARLAELRGIRGMRSLREELDRLLGEVG